MQLSRVVATSGRVAATTKRLEKIGLIATLLEQLQPEEVEIAVSFLSGGTRQGRVGIGYSTLREAIGSPAAEASLELLEVDRAFESLKSTQGSGSVGRKLELLRSIFSRATEEEQRFLTGLLGGELRQGALEGIMLESVARASRVPLERVRRAAMMAGAIPPIARALFEQGEAGLAAYDVRLFRPVQPMLAQTAENAAEAIDELGEAALEWKLDGARIQVHRSGDDVTVYSRSLNDVTAAVPEIVEAARGLPAKDLILDGEVISLKPDGRPNAFQTTMRRFGRKLDVDRMRAELPLSPFWFDLLYLNGTSLLDEPQARRFGTLVELAPATVVPHTITAAPEDAVEFFETALRHGHEGIMAKSTSAPYAAGARGQSWLKVKSPRTLDLVILAAEWGNGRRRGWLSNLHLGARDTEKGGFAMLGKTFKGLTDEMLAWQTQELLKLEIGRDKYTVHVEPKLVAEIAFNEIQVSARYQSGLALRFARVKRYRLDKSAAESDTFQTVQQLAGLTS
ncbi:MAG: ATP-dependent ligase [Bryobacterales bacterium]|nr:ATP-dependent ligase [Bryobacterales bacterium]